MADRYVLIFEKDQKFIKPLQLYFRGSNYDAETSASEGEFLAAIQRRRPSAVLVGAENDDSETRGLLGKLSRVGVPVIVMSSKRDDAELFSGGLAAVGAHGFMKKPFIKKAILEKLDDVIANNPGAGGDSGFELGSVLTEVDDQLDNLMGGGEVGISLEEDTNVDLALGSEPARTETRPTPAPVAPAAPEPVPVDVPAELKRLRERVREIEKELLEATEELKKVERDKEKIEHSVGKKESELIEKIKQLERSNEELEEDVKKRKNLVAQMTASVQQLNEELEEKDRKHDRVIEDWKGQVAKLQGDIESLNEKNSGQAHDIEDKTDELARQKRSIEDLEAERNELQINLEKMTEAKRVADENIARLDTELATERGRIAAGKASLEKGMADLRQRLLGELGNARDALERGLGQAREAAETAAQSTQEETINALLGR